MFVIVIVTAVAVFLVCSVLLASFLALIAVVIVVYYLSVMQSLFMLSVANSSADQHKLLVFMFWILKLRA